MTLTRHGQDDSAEQWRRDDDDSDNARHDTIPNTDTFAQTRGTIRLGNLAVASLTANEIITQLMHHRAHCVCGDGDQRKEFLPWDFTEGVVDLLVLDCELHGGVHFSSDVTKRDEIGTSTAAMDAGGLPS